MKVSNRFKNSVSESEPESSKAPITCQAMAKKRTGSVWYESGISTRLAPHKY